MKNKPVKNEDLFRFFSHSNTEPTPQGRSQFFYQQSMGITPSEPDPFYTSLMKGKWNFDFLTSQYHDLYFSGEWWGLLALWTDWKGNRWLLPHLLKWYYPEPPQWLSQENIEVNTILDLIKNKTVQKWD